MCRSLRQPGGGGRFGGRGAMIGRRKNANITARSGLLIVAPAGKGLGLGALSQYLETAAD